MKLPLRNAQGAEIRQIDVDDAVFGITPNLPVVHQAFVAQLANRRRGTASTLSRSAHRSSTAKTRRQKGTGRARQGSASSPLRRGGAVAHGPHPRSYRQRLPRKMRRLAIRSMLSQRVAEGCLLVLDQETFEPKTKAIQQLLGDLGVQRSGLLVTRAADADLQRGIGNLEAMHTTPADTLSVDALLRHDHIILTEPALRRSEELWGGAQAGARRRPAPAATTAAAEGG